MARHILAHWRGALACTAVLVLSAGAIVGTGTVLGQGGGERYITEQDLENWGFRQLGLLVASVWTPLTLFFVGLSWKISQWRTKTAESISENRKSIDENQRVQAGEIASMRSEVRIEMRRAQRTVSAIAEALISSDILDDDARKRLTRRILEVEDGG